VRCAYGAAPGLTPPVSPFFIRRDNSQNRGDLISGDLFHNPQETRPVLTPSFM
jgi:hypothetical protein